MKSDANEIKRRFILALVFILAVDKTKIVKRKNAEPATHAGINSMTKLFVIILFEMVTTSFSKIKRKNFNEDTVAGVKIK